jgi:hypothetical protein
MVQEAVPKLRAIGDLLQLCKLEHQRHKRTRLPITTRSGQEADERHDTAPFSQETDIFRNGFRPGIVDDNVDALAVGEPLDLGRLVRDSLVVDGADLIISRAELPDLLEFLVG